MKKFLLSLLLVFSLQGAPLPAQASNGMADILSTMMQMFLWMMSSGNGMPGFSSSGMNPYGLAGFAGQGYTNQWGGYPGSTGGLGGHPYSRIGYGGRTPYFGPDNNSVYNRYGYAGPDNHDAWDYQNPLLGRWQGVNGEFLELANNRFRLRSGNSEMQGTYQLNHGIMKAAIFNRPTPVFMQFRMVEGQLVFRSEDGQMMLFRRLD